MAVSTIEAKASIATLVNVFTVLPEQQRAMVDLLAKTTEEIMRHRPGFISTNIHASADGTKVLNCAQWESEADLRAVLAGPVAMEQLGQAQKLSVSFDPGIYHVESVHHC